MRYRNPPTWVNAQKPEQETTQEPQKIYPPGSAEDYKQRYAQAVKDRKTTLAISIKREAHRAGIVVGV